MKRHNHKQWLAARRRLLQQTRLQVAHLLGPQSQDLTLYSAAYKEEFKGLWRESSREKLLRRIQAADFVLGADFHAFAQAQRTHLRLLRSLDSRRPVILALECIESRYQKSLDRFMAGQLSEADFLKEVRWNEHWGFAWSHFQPLFQLAQDRGFPVVALNRYEPSRTAQGLERRDRHGAKILVQVKRRHPDSLVYVLYGDLHLAEPHLPQAIQEAAGLKELSLVRVFQNVEELYFRLARRGLETQVEVLEASRDRFCVLGSPPWVKWQSYLIYLEQAYDRDLEEEDGVSSAVDYTDHIHSLIQFMAQDLGVQVKSNDLAVYLPQDELIDSRLEKAMSASELRQVYHLMDSDRSFYLPHLGRLYLSRETVNHASGLAGQYLHCKLSGCQSWFWRQPEHFLQRIWVEAVGFFLSKLVNHKRKADSVRDLKAQLAATQPKDQGRESLLLALDQRLSEVIYVYSGKDRVRKFAPRHKSSYLEAARILGAMMGERLYLTYRAQRMPPKTLLQILSYNPENKDFLKFYRGLVKRLESQSLLPQWIKEV